MHVKFKGCTRGAHLTQEKGQNFQGVKGPWPFVSLNGGRLCLWFEQRLCRSDLSQEVLQRW